MTYKDLCSAVSTKTNALRSIQQVISSESFRILYEQSSDIEKKRITAIVTSCKKDEIDLWMHTHPKVELGELSLGRLRERGKRLRIKNYCRLAKFELIREIKIAEKQGDLCKLM